MRRFMNKLEAAAKNVALLVRERVLMVAATCCSASEPPDDALPRLIAGLCAAARERRRWRWSAHPCDIRQ
jgi:hypothetical protein